MLTLQILYENRLESFRTGKEWILLYEQIYVVKHI